MQKKEMRGRVNDSSPLSEAESPPNLDDLKAKAVRGAGVNFAAQLAGLFLHMASVVVLARLLTPRDFGLMAMVTAFSLWFMNFGLNGFTEYIIQKERMVTGEINSIFWAHALIAGILTVLFAGFGYVLASFYAELALRGIAIAMSLSIILVALYTTHVALLKRELKFTSVAIMNLIASFVSILLAVGAAVVGMGYWALVIRQLASPLIIVIGAWVLCPWRPGSPMHLSLAIPGLKYGIQVYLNFSLKFLRQHADRMILGKSSGSELLGEYERGYYLSSMPAEQLLTPLHNVVQATLCRLIHDKKRFVSYFNQAVSMIGILGVWAALVLMLTAEDLVWLLLGPEWAYAGRVVKAFGPGIAGMILYETHSWLHLSLGTPNRWLKWNILASVITVTSFVAVASKGPIAMAFTLSVVTNLLVIPALWYAGRPLELSLRTLVGPFWSYYLSASVVAVCWMAASTSWVPLRDALVRLGTVGRVASVGAAVSVLYILLIILIERSFRSIREIMSFIRIFFTRFKA